MSVSLTTANQDQPHRTKETLHEEHEKREKQTVDNKYTMEEKEDNLRGIIT